MAIVYRTDGAWGVGQGSNLAPAQVDNNFWDLAGRITYIEDNPILPIEPISITITGYDFYMGLSNGEVLGPVTMTMPVPEWRGDWTPSTLYHDMDFIIAPDGGFGAVMQEHTSAATFDWAATDPDNSLPQYRLIVGSNGMTVAYSDLTDVALSGLADHDMPAWDSTAGYWRNRTPAQVAANLTAFTGDSGSGGVKGLVPAPAAGDAAAGKVLGAAGAWVTVTSGGGSGVTGPGTSVVDNLATWNSTTGAVLKDSGIAAASVLVSGGPLGTPSGGSAANLTAIPVSQATGILGATHGGAGSVTGLLKANGLGTVAAAVADVDYALPGGSGSNVTVAATPPPSPAAGDLWWDSAGGQLYVRYDDGSGGAQWVIAVNQPGPTGATGAQGPAGTYQAGTGISINTGTTPPTITDTLASSGGTVGGTLTVNGNVSANGTFTVNRGVGAPAPVYLQSARNWAIFAHTDGKLYVNDDTSVTTRLTLDSAGLATLTGALTLVGTAGDSVQVTVPSGQWCRAKYTVTGARTWAAGIIGNDWSISDETAGATRLQIDTSGACSASSTWAVISDMRLKEASSIEEYPRGLQEILALNPIYYQWNGKGGVPADGEIHFGLAAQNVEEVLPELIREHEYTPPEGSDDEPMTLKTYSPTDITFALVNAIKSLQAQIDELKSQLRSRRT